MGNIFQENEILKFWQEKCLSCGIYCHYYKSLKVLLCFFKKNIKNLITTYKRLRKQVMVICFFNMIVTSFEIVSSCILRQTEALKIASLKPGSMVIPKNENKKSFILRLKEIVKYKSTFKKFSN